MLQAYAKAQQKELSQIITIYQSILEFSFEELGMNVIIKHAKSEPDNLIDDVNAKLIDVCDEFLKENKLPLDKYQLSMIVMKLYTQTIASLPQPFYVQARESKNLLKEYVKANKEYIKKVEKVKRENQELSKEALELEKKNKELEKANEKTLDITTTTTTIKVNDSKGNEKEIPIHRKVSAPKKKNYNHDTNNLATEFTF